MWKRSATSRKGWQLLQTLPETPERLQHELDMHIRLGCIADCHQRLWQLPKSEQTYLRARQLCQQMGRRLTSFSHVVAWTVEVIISCAPSCRRHMHWVSSS